VNVLDDTLSQQNSNSMASLVEITAPPFVYAESLLTGGGVLVGAVVFVVVVGVGMLAGIFVLRRFPREKRA
ncbi:hypothetical protein D4R30_00505, partial [archaeon]